MARDLYTIIDFTGRVFMQTEALSDLKKWLTPGRTVSVTITTKRIPDEIPEPPPPPLLIFEEEDK